MENNDKTRIQLIEEVKKLTVKISELEKSETERQPERPSAEDSSSQERPSETKERFYSDENKKNDLIGPASKVARVDLSRNVVLLSHSELQPE